MKKTISIVLVCLLLLSAGAAALAADWGLTPDQLGMKLGMLVGALFPLMGIGVYRHLHRTEPISE